MLIILCKQLHQQEVVSTKEKKKKFLPDTENYYCEMISC